MLSYLATALILQLAVVLLCSTQAASHLRHSLDVTNISDKIIAKKYQPKVVLTVEALPARKIFGSLSVPNGSPWCDGLPTFWMVGHQDSDETPWCLEAPRNAITGQKMKIAVDFFVNGYDYSKKRTAFNRPRNVVLDTNDPLNAAAGDKNLDRHDCAAIDVNHDNLLDVICLVGADKGTGTGFTEVYLTVENNNNSTDPAAAATTTNGLQKVLQGHGLQKYPTTRSRFVKPLKGADGSELLFVAARGAERTDGLTNVHRCYRNVKTTTDANATTAGSTTATEEHAFYFEEVPGPWDQLHTEAGCLIVADLNGDGIDDILVCNQRQNALIYLQNTDSTFTLLPPPTNGEIRWRQARAADVTGDGIVDLVVVGLGRSEYAPKDPSFIRIYKGSQDYPYFDFSSPPYFERTLPYGTPDVEILDVNTDGIADIYVVQTDEMTPGTYCAGTFENRDWWAEGNQPPTTFVPPLDLAPDLLLVGSKTNPANNSSKYTEVFMKHAEPGCGFLTELFGCNRTMILGQGTNNRPGHSLLLQW